MPSGTCRWPRSGFLWKRKHGKSPKAGKEEKIAFPRRGEIYLVHFDPTVGHEIQKTRPAVVIQNDISNQYSPITIVAAISSQFSRSAVPQRSGDRARSERFAQTLGRHRQPDSVGGPAAAPKEDWPSLGSEYGASGRSHQDQPGAFEIVISKRRRSWVTKQRKPSIVVPNTATVPTGDPRQTLRKRATRFGASDPPQNSGRSSAMPAFGTRISTAKLPLIGFLRMPGPGGHNSTGQRDLRATLR